MYSLLNWILNIERLLERQLSPSVDNADTEQSKRFTFFTSLERKQNRISYNSNCIKAEEFYVPGEGVETFHEEKGLQ